LLYFEKAGTATAVEGIEYCTFYDQGNIPDYGNY
jgi:hypothetical protein